MRHSFRRTELLFKLEVGFLENDISPFTGIDKSLSKLLTTTRTSIIINSKLINKGKYNEDANRYIPGTLSLKFQGMFNDVITREQPTHILYKDMENLKFQMMLLLNHYVNPNSFYNCFPIKMEKQQTQIMTMTVNNNDK